MGNIKSKTKELSGKLDTIKLGTKSFKDVKSFAKSTVNSPYLNQSELKKKLLGDGSGKSFNTDFISQLLDTLIQSSGGGPDATKGFVKKIIKKITNDAPKITKIVIEELLRSLNCESDLSLGPLGPQFFKVSSIDLFDLLKVSPDTVAGRAMYEKKSISDLTYPQSTNKFLHNVTVNTTAPTYSSHNGLELFDIAFSQSTEEYTLTFKDISLSDFISNYYSSFELFNSKELMTDIIDMLFGVFSVDVSNKRVNSFEELNQFMKAISALCSDFYESDSLIKEGLIDRVSTQDEELSFTFDDEDTRYIEENFNLKINKLYRLSDCGNYEAEMNPEMLIDTLMDLDSGIPENEVIDNFLNNIGSHVQDSGFDVPNVNLNFNTDIFKQIPKVIVSKILGPKSLLPFVVLTSAIDSTKEGSKDIKGFVNSNNSFVTRITKRVFDMYKEELFKEIKKRLTVLITELVMKIVSQQLKGRYAIILSLLSALGKLKSMDLTSCIGILNGLMSLLKLKTGIPLGIPMPMLYGAYIREGANSTRAFINGVDNLQKIGYNTGDLPDGSINKHVLGQKSFLDGLMQETAENGAIQFVSQPASGVHPLGPVVTPFVLGKGIILTSFD